MINYVTGLNVDVSTNSVGRKRLRFITSQDMYDNNQLLYNRKIKIEIHICESYWKSIEANCIVNHKLDWHTIEFSFNFKNTPIYLFMQEKVNYYRNENKIFADMEAANKLQTKLFD